MKNDIRERTLFDYPRELRGFPQNRWGGYRTIRIQTYPPLLPFGSARPMSDLYRRGKARA